MVAMAIGWMDDGSLILMDHHTLGSPLRPPDDITGLGTKVDRGFNTRPLVFYVNFGGNVESSPEKILGSFPGYFLGIFFGHKKVPQGTFSHKKSTLGSFFGHKKVP